MSRYEWFWRGETYKGKTILPESHVQMNLVQNGYESFLEIKNNRLNKFLEIDKAMRETEVGYLDLRLGSTIMEEWEFVGMSIVGFQRGAHTFKHIVSFSDATYIQGVGDIQKHKNYWLELDKD